MVEYNKVNVKLGTTLRIRLRMFNGNNLLHELLLTTRQKTKVRNAFNNNTSTDLKLSKTQISKIIQSGGFLGRNVMKPLAKRVLIPLGLTAAVSAADAGTHKKY